MDNILVSSTKLKSVTFAVSGRVLLPSPASVSGRVVDVIDATIQRNRVFPLGRESRARSGNLESGHIREADASVPSPKRSGRGSFGVCSVVIPVKRIRIKTR